MQLETNVFARDIFEDMDAQHLILHGPWEPE